MMLISTLCGAVQAQENILAARHHPTGSVVTVQGIVLNATELGKVRYVQDSSAAIAVYPGGSSPSSFTQATTGDEILVTGVLTDFHGLLEINPILEWQHISSANELPEPLDISLGKINPDDQGKLVHISCAQFSNSPGVFQAGSQILYTPDGSSASLYVDNGNALNDETLPSGPVDLVVIASAYDGLRFLIRSGDDISLGTCFYIPPKPVQHDIAPTEFGVSWLSSEPGIGICIIQNEGGITDTLLTGSDPSTDHTLLVGQLDPATFYTVRAGAATPEGDSAWYPPIVMSTASNSSGDIAVYFTQPVDHTYSTGLLPAGESFSAMLGEILELIGSALQSIDVAMYNSNRPDIIFALEQAKQRGVRVRYIADGGQSNSALDPLPAFPVLFRNGDGIMHDKFMVIDPGDPARATVWTGSTNHTTNQLSVDPNNAIVIQDHALARVYQMEFEEMWGGSGNEPNVVESRTGSEKRDDTPHLFQIGDRLVECYFSPSDQTNTHIRKALDAATVSIDAALLLLTRTDLSAAMVDRTAAGAYTRVIIDDAQSSGAAIQTLQNGGVLVATHDYNAIFHHKYALIDDASPDALLITGSHNWTTSATTINDENTLFVHDPGITNLYRQEFEARWAEVYTSAVKENGRPHMIRVFPNPADETLYLSEDVGVSSFTIYSVTGHYLATGESPDQGIDVHYLPNGMYYIRALCRDGSAFTLPFIKL